jgi:hypothetical protein
VPLILHWVERAVTRLAAHTSRIRIAGLPMAAIGSLGRRRFTVLRTLLVPGCRLSLAEVHARAEAVEAGLAQLAARAGATFCPLQPQWFGCDPMHVRRRHHRAAFAHLLDFAATPPPTHSARLDGPLARARFFTARPAQSTWFGHRRHTPQPACTFADGSRAALF